MDNHTELHVILGNGPLGMAIMQQLHARGTRVRVVSRSGRARVPAGVEVVAADVTDHAAARRAAQGATVIYNCLNAPYTEWPRVFPKLMDGAIEAASATGAKLVCADNLYAYGAITGPMHEGLPHAATTRKGRVRAQVADALMTAHARGKLRATIGRASDFYGPRVLDSAAGERVFAHALTGKPADVLGNIDMPHTYAFIDDFARALITLGERDEALGKVWHVPSAETLTTRQFVELVYRETGAAPRMRVASRGMLTALGVFMPLLRELKEMLYEFEEPFVVDHSRYADVFGDQSTPHREAIRQTLAWYRHREMSATVAAQEPQSAKVI